MIHTPQASGKSFHSSLCKMSEDSLTEIFADMPEALRHIYCLLGSKFWILTSHRQISSGWHTVIAVQNSNTAEILLQVDKEAFDIPIVFNDEVIEWIEWFMGPGSLGADRGPH